MLSLPLKRLYQKTFHRDVDKVLRIFFDTQVPCINFATTDPLEIISNPLTLDQVTKYSIEYGYHTKNSSLRNIIESKLSFHLNKEKVLLLEYTPNIYDLIHAAFLSYGCKLFTNPSHHQTLQNDLEISKGPNIVCINALTPFVKQIGSLCQETDSLLLVDDKGTFTLGGEEGFGMSSNFPEADLIIGQIPKNFGYYATYIATSTEILNLLKLKIPQLLTNCLHSTPLLAAIDSTISLLPTMQTDRNTLTENRKLLQTRLLDLGYDVVNSMPYCLTLNLESFTESDELYRKIIDLDVLFPQPKRSHPHSPVQISLSLPISFSEKKLHSFANQLPTAFNPPKVESL